MRSKDKITVQIGDVHHDAKLPFPNADHCIVDIPCPHCKVEQLGVVGSGRFIDPDARHDTWAAEGYATCCKMHVGLIRVKIAGTLFGIEEDQRVANMGIRIY